MCKKIKIERYKAYLSDFLREFGYADEAKKTLEDAFDRLFPDDVNEKLFGRLRRKYERDPDMRFSFLKETADKIAARKEISPYTVYLVILILLSESSKAVYAARKVSPEMWRANMTDLKYTCDLCILLKGVYGTYCPVWYDRFFAATRFTFGRLQFELSRLGKAHRLGDLSLSPDDKAIFIHIPRTGEKLLPADVDAACEAASRFFRERFRTKRTLFACHSWLLYPENEKILSEGSNLRSFISRFEIIHVEDHPDYRDLWRLFDKDYDGDPDALPQDTSLRRAYAQRVKEGKPLGAALGVWLYKG